jgi:beta-galactosidase
LNYQPVLAFFISLILAFISNATFAQQNIRQEISLNNNWHTVADDNNQKAYPGFEQVSFKDNHWKTVNVPHNWDTYEGYRRVNHCNRHG